MWGGGGEGHMGKMVLKWIPQEQYFQFIELKFKRFYKQLRFVYLILPYLNVFNPIFIRSISPNNRVICNAKSSRHSGQASKFIAIQGKNATEKIGEGQLNFGDKADDDRWRGVAFCGHVYAPSDNTRRHLQFNKHLIWLFIFSGFINSRSHEICGNQGRISPLSTKTFECVDKRRQC